MPNRRIVVIGAVAVLIAGAGLVVWLAFWWWLSGPKYEYAWVTPDDEIAARPFRGAAFQEDPDFVTCNRSQDDDPALSWKGNDLAFASDRDGDWDIYVLRDDKCFKYREGGKAVVEAPEDTRVTQLTNDPGIDRHPAWSPDGKSIAFDSDRNGTPQIYVVNADGSDLHQLTSGPDLPPEN